MNAASLLFQSARLVLCMGLFMCAIFEIVDEIDWKTSDPIKYALLLKNRSNLHGGENIIWFQRFALFFITLFCAVFI